MAVNKPDIYQHNNPDLAFVDSNFIKGGFRTAVGDVSELYALSAKTGTEFAPGQLKEYATIVYVSGKTKYYILKDIDNVSNSNGWEEFVTGGGTGTITGATNIGSGTTIYSGTSGQTLVFNTIVGSGNIVVNKIGNEIVISNVETYETVSRTIYVATGGSDSSGDGTAGLPFASLLRAYQDIKDVIEESVTITIDLAAGSYTADYSVIQNELFRITRNIGSSIVISGKYQTVASGLTFTSVGGVTPYIYNVGGTTFTTNQHQDRFVLNSGNFYPIVKNTTNQITSPYVLGTSIVENTVNLTITNGDLNYNFSNYIGSIDFIDEIRNLNIISSTELVIHTNIRLNILNSKITAPSIKFGSGLVNGSLQGVACVLSTGGLSINSQNFQSRRLSLRKTGTKAGVGITPTANTFQKSSILTVGGIYIDNFIDGLLVDGCDIRFTTGSVGTSMLVIDGASSAIRVTENTSINFTNINDLCVTGVTNLIDVRSGFPVEKNLNITFTNIIKGTPTNYLSTSLAPYGYKNLGRNIFINIPGISSDVEVEIYNNGSINVPSGATYMVDGVSIEVEKGNLTENISNVLVISGGTDAVIGSGTTIQVQQATSISDGYLSSTDWNIFNNKADVDETETASRTIYVSTTGSDVTGDGTSLGTAFATILRALQDIKQYIYSSTITISLNGTGSFQIDYDAGFEMAKKTAINSSVIFTGIDYTTIESGFTLAKTASRCFAYTLTKSGLTATLNQYFGNFATNGTVYYPIASNTAGTNSFEIEFLHSDLTTPNSIINWGASITNPTNEVSAYDLGYAYCDNSSIIFQNLNIENTAQAMKLGTAQSPLRFLNCRFNSKNINIGSANDVNPSSLRFDNCAMMETTVNPQFIIIYEQISKAVCRNCLIAGISSTSLGVFYNKSQNTELTDIYIIGSSGVTNMGINSLHSANLLKIGGMIKIKNVNSAIYPGNGLQIVPYNSNAALLTKYWEFENCSNLFYVMPRSMCKINIPNIYGSLPAGIVKSVTSGFSFVDPENDIHISIPGIYGEFETPATATLADNSTGTTQVGNTAQNKSVFIKYIITRGSDQEQGSIWMDNENDVEISIVSEFDDCGVTFSKQISGTSINLNWLTTSTGTAATFSYSIERIMV